MEDKTEQVVNSVRHAKQVAIDFIIQYGFQVLGALIIIACGCIVARWVGNFVQKALMKHEMEPPIRSLIVRGVRLLVVLLTVIISLDTAGVKMAPLIAGLGVAGVGIGLALQGVLGNLFAGLFIIIVKKFRVGEYIDILGEEGEVANIELFNTTLIHPDQSRIIIPNRKIIGEILHNYGTSRQLILPFSVPYDTDVDAAIELIRSTTLANPKVLKEPAPPVGVSEFGDSAIVVTICPWVPVKEFGAAKAELNSAILKRLNAAKIIMPFPQQEIRILNDAPSILPPEQRPPAQALLK